MNRCYYKVRGGKGQLDFFIFIFYGGFHPPNPLTAERGGANFWRVPRHPAPIFLTNDDRYGLQHTSARSSVAKEKGTKRRGMNQNSLHGVPWLLAQHFIPLIDISDIV